MNGTLLCGVEETDGGRRAVELALQISGRLDLRLVLVNVVHVPGRGGADIDDEIYARHRQSAAVMLRRLAQDLELVDSVERRVTVGDAASSLARIAAEEAADLIVIGDSRRAGFGRRSSGRVAAQLDWETPVPVVVAMRHGRSRGRGPEPAADAV